MDILFYMLGLTLVFSYIFELPIQTPDKCLAFGFVRILFILPLLASAYLYFASDMTFQLVPPVVFLENVLSLIWILMAYRLPTGLDEGSQKSTPHRLLMATGGILVLGAGFYGYLNPPTIDIVSDAWVFPRFEQVYLSALVMLMAAFVMAWRLEMYWRALSSTDRWRSKFLVVGFFLASGSLLWCASYRLSYMRLVDDHILLLSALLLIAWLLVSYSVARHRLLNRKLFVSRKVVYSAIAPTIFAGYLILLGTTSVMIRAFGWSLNFVLQWLLAILGLLLFVVLALSGRVRKSMKYFISTHFYVNKYEYRDEWLAFSNLLQGTLTEKGVVDALHLILKECLYTDTILIWLGDTTSGVHLVDGDRDHGKSLDPVIAADDPLFLYLLDEPYFYLGDAANATNWQGVFSDRREFFLRTGVVLAVPLSIGGQCVGVIGLGPEHTKGRYGRDDFDLLKALGSQAASAILAARTAETLARNRETSAWATLSAFVLHDIKNAATMLNLVKENAPAHIHKAEFQQDMLASIDDALKRMHRVQERLNTLKDEAMPTIEAVEIGRLVNDCCNKLAQKIPDLTIEVQCLDHPTIQTDSDMIAQILENLLINALETGGPGTRVHVNVSNTAGNPRAAQLEIVDNGPGIPTAMLPNRLFEPFKTSKPKGTGIGLWQVKRRVESLGGSIHAENIPSGGAKFSVRLPLKRVAS